MASSRRSSWGLASENTKRLGVVRLGVDVEVGVVPLGDDGDSFNVPYQGGLLDGLRWIRLINSRK
jgi:hypothetical protein